MTLQDLRYLIALVDHAHFGRAAAACHVSQPTLSTQIKKLEDHLGVTLIERTTKSVRVTEAGAEVVAHARQIFVAVDAITSVGHRGAKPLSGGFRLGVIPTLGPYLLPWLVPALKKGFTELRLAVREDITAHLLESIALHRLDAAFVALPVPDERIESLPLFDEPFWLAEPRRRGSIKPGILDENDLHGKKLLLLTEGHCLRDQALAVCGTESHDAQEDFRATSLETIWQMVATGLGSTLLPALARREFRSRAVITHPLAGIGRRVGLVWRQSYPKVADLQQLARTVLDHLPEGVRPVQGDL